MDLSSSTGLASPTVQSTLLLNAASVQVRSSPSASWNSLRRYQFSYDQGGPVTIPDPATGKQESTAGRLKLTQLLEVGSNGLAQMPARSFGYSELYQYYEDDVYHAASSSNCIVPISI